MTFENDLVGERHKWTDVKIITETFIIPLDYKVWSFLVSFMILPNTLISITLDTHVDGNKWECFFFNTQFSWCIVRYTTSFQRLDFQIKCKCSVLTLWAVLESRWTINDKTWISFSFFCTRTHFDVSKSIEKWILIIKGKRQKFHFILSCRYSRSTFIVVTIILQFNVDERFKPLIKRGLFLR